MIDRIAIERLYQHPKCQKYIEDFYKSLVVFTQTNNPKPVEKALYLLNQQSKAYKSRLVYYDNHCIKTDLEQFIVETYRLNRKEG